MGLLWVQHEATEGQQCSRCSPITTITRENQMLCDFLELMKGKRWCKSKPIGNFTFGRTTDSCHTVDSYGSFSSCYGATHNSDMQSTALCWTYPHLGTRGHHHPPSYREPVKGAGADPTWSRNFGRAACFNLDCTHRQWDRTSLASSEIHHHASAWYKLISWTNHTHYKQQ